MTLFDALEPSESAAPSHTGVPSDSGRSAASTNPRPLQGTEDYHDTVERHKINEARVSRKLDHYIRDYLEKCLANTDGWSGWFYAAPQVGLDNPNKSLANWCQAQGATAAADSYRRRFKAVAKEMGLEVENLNSKGLYRVRRK